MSNWKEYILPILIGLSALSVSASAAIYSVSGLAKLFAGATLQVMIMAGSLEIAKLVTATLLHQYWNSINRLLKFYLTLAVVVLVLITSMGIYGFLSSAYQSTAVIYETSLKEVDFLKQKQLFYSTDLNRYDLELDRISSNITELSKSKTVQYEISDPNAPGGKRTAISTIELRSAEARLKIEDTNRIEIFNKRNQTADSLKNIQTQILNLEVQSSSNSELGPLIYLSELTGRPMNEIINILLLIIIFVFDPLAIALVLAANFAFDSIKKTLKPELDIKEEPRIEVVEEVERVEPTSILVQQPSKVITNEPEVISSQHESTFDTMYTGLEFKDIVKIIQKTPGYYALLLKSGKRVKIPRELYHKLEQENSNTITY